MNFKLASDLTSDIDQVFIDGLERSRIVIEYSAIVILLVSWHNVVKLEVITVVDEMDSAVFVDQVQSDLVQSLNPCDVQVRIVVWTI